MVVKDKHGTVIKEGDVIKASIIGSTTNHIKQFNGNFSMDLSYPVTVRKNDKGLLMAGQLSLLSYANKIVEIVNNEVTVCKCPCCGSLDTHKIRTKPVIYCNECKETT